MIIHLHLQIVISYHWFIGGLSELGEELKVFECYNPVSDTWIRQPDMRHRRAYLGLAALGGSLYAVGKLCKLD